MLLPVGPPSHIVPYRPVNLLHGVIDARSCQRILYRTASIHLRVRTVRDPAVFPATPSLVCRFSPTSCSPFFHLYLDVLRARPAVLSRFRGDPPRKAIRVQYRTVQPSQPDPPRYCRHSICPARSALYVDAVVLSTAL